MMHSPEKPPRRARPWWRSRVAYGAALVAVVLGLVLMNSLVQWVSWTAWLLALLALTAWLLTPDLAWAWREHPEVVRRVLVLLTRPRTVRVALYVLLAYAWYVTMF